MSHFPSQLHKIIDNILICADVDALEFLLDQGLPLSLSDKTDQSQFGVGKIAEHFAWRAPHTYDVIEKYERMLEVLLSRGAQCVYDEPSHQKQHPFNPLWAFCAKAHTYSPHMEPFLEKIYYAGCDPRPGLAALNAAQYSHTPELLYDDLVALFQKWSSEYEKGIILQDIPISNQHSKKKIM